MFRIEVFVDDKKLAYVLWALSGHCIEVKPPQPVNNAQVKNGKIAARVPSGKRVDMLMEYLREKKITKMEGPGVIRDFCLSMGIGDKSYSNVITNAIKAKLISRRKVGKGKGGFIYTVAKGA